MPYHVSKKEFAELVEQAIAELPDQFAEFLEEVSIEIHTRPWGKLRKELGLKKNDLLMGLYTGVDLIDRSVEDAARLPNLIYVFQEDHELVCESKSELVHEVRTTVLHEIGHHFGMTEEDLERLGYE